VVPRKLEIDAPPRARDVRYFYLQTTARIMAPRIFYYGTSYGMEKKRT